MTDINCDLLRIRAQTNAVSDERLSYAVTEIGRPYIPTRMRVGRPENGAVETGRPINEERDPEIRVGVCLP